MLSWTVKQRPTKGFWVQQRHGRFLKAAFLPSQSLLLQPCFSKAPPMFLLLIYSRGYPDYRSCCVIPAGLTVTCEIFASCRDFFSPPNVCKRYPDSVCPPFPVTLPGLFALWDHGTGLWVSWVIPSPVIPWRWNEMPLSEHPGEGTQGCSELLSANLPCPDTTAMTPLNEAWPLQMTFLSHLLVDQRTSSLVLFKSVCTSYHKRVSAKRLLGQMALLGPWKYLCHSPCVNQREWVAPTNLFGVCIVPRRLWRGCVTMCEALCLAQRHVQEHEDDSPCPSSAQMAVTTSCSLGVGDCNKTKEQKQLSIY